MTTGSGTKDDPWSSRPPPRTSSYTMYRDDSADPPVMSARWVARACSPERTDAHIEPLPAAGWHGLTRPAEHVLACLFTHWREQRENVHAAVLEGPRFVLSRAW
jgi:hypothetical protein